MSQTATVSAELSQPDFQVTCRDDLGHQWLADEPVDLGGGNTAATPDRLLLGSLGSCTAITLMMVAKRKQIPLQAIQVNLSLNPKGKPEAGNDIERQISLTGELTEEHRVQLLRAANACPVHKILTGEVRIATNLL